MGTLWWRRGQCTFQVRATQTVAKMSVCCPWWEWRGVQQVPTCLHSLECLVSAKHLQQSRKTQEPGDSPEVSELAQGPWRSGSA